MDDRELIRAGIRAGMILQTEEQNRGEYLRLKEITKGIPLGELEELCQLYKAGQVLRELPCRIGDEVYILCRSYCKKRIKRGFVTEMFYDPEMTLKIKIKNIGTGVWGKTIFASCEDAEKAEGAKK